MEPHPKAGPPPVDILTKGLWRDNPVIVMGLGLCSVLAVTNTVLNALAIGLSTAFVLVMSSILVSLVRKIVPKQVRIASFVLIIATFVTVVDYLLQSISLEIHKALGPFLALIVVNCIILGRAEAFASRHGVWLSTLDALGMGGGYTLAALSLGVIREVLGSGTLAGIPVMGPSFEPWVILVLPGGAFLVLGVILMLYSWLSQRGAAKETA